MYPRGRAAQPEHLMFEMISYLPWNAVPFTLTYDCVVWDSSGFVLIQRKLLKETSVIWGVFKREAENYKCAAAPLKLPHQNVHRQQHSSRELASSYIEVDKYMHTSVAYLNSHFSPCFAL